MGEPDRAVMREGVPRMTVTRVMRSPRRIVALIAASALATGMLLASTPQAAHADDATSAGQAAQDRLIPRPESVVEHEDEEPFRIADGTRIVSPDEFDAAADLFAQRLRSSTGYEIPVVSDEAREGDIVLRSGEVTGHAGEEEAYSLTVSAENVEITTETDHGAFDALQTLRQLLPAFVESSEALVTEWRVPAVSVTDAPRFDRRSAMLDVGRSFLSVDEVKSYLDDMASVKMSMLHFHLTDDAGWRIQITNDGKEDGDPIDYSQLTSVSGKTGMTEGGYENELGHTGFYTQSDYREIVRYAAQRHITVVPEIDAPGHTNSALHAIPELNTDATKPRPGGDGTAPENGTGNVGYSTLDANADITWTFMRHVLSQLADMTPGDYIDIGGDESRVTSSEDYVAFVTKSADIVHDLGKRMMGWSEVAVGAPKKDDILQYWSGGETEAVLDAVENQGAKVIASPSSQAYLDMKYDGSTPIGLTWAGTGGFDTYYDWDPKTVIPEAEGGLPDSAFAGVEGSLWSETVRGLDQAEFLTFPRLFSIAEIAWTPSAERDADDFSERVAAMGERLLASGTNFYDGSDAAWTWSMAGIDTQVAPGRDVSLSVGRIAAPGTEAAADGSSIAVDDDDDENGTADSTLDGELTATIDWGDGSSTDDAVFRTETARSSLRAGGLYSLVGTHAYADAGSYTGTVTASDGTERPFEVDVAEGTPDPGDADPWDPSVTPTLEADAEVTAGDRLSGTLSGFEPGTAVELSLDGAPLGSVRPDAEGRRDLSLPIPESTYSGDAVLVARSGDREASASLHVEGQHDPLENRISHTEMKVVDVDSEETTGESAPATNAIDGDPTSYWHTEWSEHETDYDHWIILDLGDEYEVSQMSYTQRGGTQTNGRMKDYDLYVSETPDGGWDDPVASGEFDDGTDEQIIGFDEAKTGRYVKLVGHDSINGNVFGGAAEIALGGTLVDEPGPGDGTDDGTDDGSPGGDDSGDGEASDGASGSGSEGADADGAGGSSDGTHASGAGAVDTEADAEGELPWTGVSLAAPLTAAALALLTGAVFLIGARRRRRG